MVGVIVAIGPGDGGVAVGLLRPGGDGADGVVGVVELGEDGGAGEVVGDVAKEKKRTGMFSVKV